MNYLFCREYHLKSRLSLIVRVNVVLNRTVVVDSDWRFDNLCSSRLQSSYSGLRSPGQSNSTYFWNDSWVQTFHSFNIIWERWISPMTTYDLICISQMHPHRMKRNRPLHFRVPNRLTFKIRPSAQPFLWKWVLFGWALNLVLIPRPGGTRKWPIIKLVSRVYSFMLHLLSWQQSIILLVSVH